MAIAELPKLSSVSRLPSVVRPPRFDASDPSQLNQLLELVGQRTVEKPKVNFLEWLLSVPSAIGSIPDAFLESRNRGTNIIEEYLKNLGEGISTLITRDKPEQAKKTFSDILDEFDLLQGEDFASKALKSIAGFAGDVALDPVTYLSFGTGSIAKEGAKAAVKEGSKNVLKDIALGKGDDVLKILGKEVTSNPAIVQAAKLATNPIGTIAGVGFRGAKAAAPETVEKITDTFNQLFRKRAAGEKVSKDLVSLLDEAQSSKRAVERLTINEQTQILDRIQKLPEDLRKRFVDYFEGTLKTPEADILSKIDSELPKLEQFYIQRGSTPTQIANYFADKTNARLNYITKFLDRDEQKDALVALLSTIDDSDKYYGTVKNIAETMFGVKEIPDNLTSLIRDVKKATEPGQDIYRQLAGLTDEAQPQVPSELQETLFGDATQVLPPGARSSVKEDILPQMDLIPTSQEQVPYLKREGLGLREKFFTDRSPAILDELKQFKEVQRDLDKLGYVSFRTLDKIQKINPQVGQRIRGLTDPLNEFGDSILERTFRTKAEGEAAGVVYNDDVGTMFLKTVANPEKAQIDYQLGKSLENITDNSGNKLFYTASQAKLQFPDRLPAGWSEFEIKNVGKFVAPNDAIRVIKDYAQDFIGDEGTKNVIKLYDDFLSVFKASVTTKGPGVIGFNIRNAIGDFQNMIAGGFRNRDNAFSKALQFAKFEKMVQKEGLEAATAKYGDDIAELYERAIKSGIVGSGSIDEIARKTGIAKTSVSEGLIDKLDEITDKVFGVKYQRGREELFRVANLWDAFQRTGDWKEAIKLAKLSSLDYSNLTSFERNVMRRIIPFYSFIRQNLELQMSVLNKTPGMFVAQQKFFDNFRKLLEDGDATDEDYSVLPNWMKEGIYAIVGKSGPSVDVLTGFGDTQSALNDIIGATPQETLQNLISNSSPLVRSPIEVATGVDTFTGEKISERKPGSRYSDMPKPVKDFLDYREVERTRKDGTKFKEITVNGYAAYLLQTMPIISVLMTSTKRTQEALADPKYLVNLLSGGRIYERNLDTEKLRREREETERIQELLTQLGIGKSYENFYVPIEERNQLAKLLR